MTQIKESRFSANNKGLVVKLPLQHVAIIMDGNRRYAQKKHIAKHLGHEAGVKNLKTIVQHAGSIGLNYLTVYAFSSENWNRSKEEVTYLFDLFYKVLLQEFDELERSGVKLRFIGNLAKLPAGLVKSMIKSMNNSKNNPGLCLQVAVNYGSRMEITEAVKNIVQDALQGKVKLNDIDESLLNSYLYTQGIPDPELLIRTGGQMRLSNYLLWQSAYTELYITPTMWPEFTSQEFDRACEVFAKAKRNYGGD